MLVMIILGIAAYVYRRQISQFFHKTTDSTTKIKVVSWLRGAEHNRARALLIAVVLVVVIKYIVD